VHNCSFVCGEAEIVLGQMAAHSERFEAAVTDPPRAGMHPKAISGLIDLRPARIVYISCNPQALGIDLSRLQAAGYRTAYVQVVDMFPHTAHCEVIARLEHTA
jgi:23S rRNA (uracil1939-C5)-methyltransferase